jgi:5-methylcytosine-specific restriction protein A
MDQENSMTWPASKPPRIKTLPNRIATADLRRVKPAPADKSAHFQGPGFYQSLPWRKLKAQIFRVRGHKCEDPDCQTPNRGEGQWIAADHIVELRDGGNPLDAGNILLRCYACHSRKTHAMRKSRNSGRPPPDSTQTRSSALFDPNAPGRFTIA